MSENSANKRNNYFNRKRNNKNKNRNDSDDSAARGVSNYQRLLSNSSKPDSRNYTSQMNPIILKYVNGGQGEPNLLPWLERSGTILLAKYGNSAKFFTGEPYKREVPPTNVFNKTNDPSGVKRKLQETMWVEYIKETSRLKEDRPKIWGDMESYMSKESLDAVRARPIYEQLKATFKVVSFLKLIKEVHRTEPAVRSSADAVADALQEFHSIKQSTDESLIDYKNRIIAAVERIETADPAQKPDASTVARKFTRSLDLNWFEELVRQCRDDETKYAATLSAAHNQASSQLIAVKGKLVPCETLKRNSNIAGAAEIKGLSKREYKMVMSMRKADPVKDEHNIDGSNGKGRKRKSDTGDNVAAAAANNKKYKRNQEKPVSNSSDEGNSTCDLCNRSNHTTENCYYLNRCREMVTQQRNQRQQQFNSNPGGYQPQYQSNYSNGPTSQFQPGRLVTYGNTSGVSNNQLNYGYPGRQNPIMRPFNQS